jgi:small subunit ribosomal protein S27Ae
MARNEYYEDGEEVRDRCPRCGDTFLAQHDDRQHCGACGYTEWE